MGRPRKYHISKAWLEKKHLGEGLSDTAIARIVGCSEGVIRSRRKEHGIPIQKQQWGGKNNPMYGKKHTPETSAKMRRFHVPEEWLREKYIEEQLTDMQIAKLIGCSEAAIGLYRHEFGIKARSWKGSRHTQEAKDRMSESHKGCIPWSKGRVGVYSQEALQKMSEAATQREKRPHTEATKRKIGAANKQYDITEEFLKQKYLEETLLDTEIAELIGCSQAHISRCRAQYGIPTITNREVSAETAQKISTRVKNAWASGVYDGVFPPSVTYRGTRMRSTWEARLAAAFDAMGWEWEYESHKFQYALEDGSHTYTPDFYVPEIDCHFDPHWSFKDDWAKFNAVREQAGINLIVLNEQLLKSYEHAAGVRRV